MGKFDPYKIDLKRMVVNVQEYEYSLENKFFADIDADQIQKGKLNAKLTVKKLSAMYELNFDIEGFIIIPCDRCLDDMNLPVKTSGRLIVKFGKEYTEESDEIVVIPEEEGIINVAWFLYEFIVLTIPIKHVHLPGKCNKIMTSKLKKHTPKNVDGDDDSLGFEEEDELLIIDEDESATDPRWDALKSLSENEND